MTIVNDVSSNVKPIAQAGLVAKGIVYLLLGVFAFMAAFHINGQSSRNTDKTDVFGYIYHQTGGQLLLGIVTVGLFCYTLWRVIQCFADTENKGTDLKGIASRSRYLFSGLVYASVAVAAVKILFSKSISGGDNQQNLAKQILSKPFGQWLLGLAAVTIIIVGFYQIYYALTEKYRKHIERASSVSARKLMLTAGKMGYVSRGIVWLIVGWLLGKAAYHSNSSEAGDTSKAFNILGEGTFGMYILGAVGLGFVCYGAFSFIRARYERF